MKFWFGMIDLRVSV